MHATLPFVLFLYTVKNLLTKRYDLDLNAKEMCINVGILNICEEVNDSCCSKSSF